jgi:hypothetical protein
MCATIFRQRDGDQAKPFPFFEVNFSRRIVSAYAYQGLCFRPSIYWRRHVRTCSNHTVHIAYELCEGRQTIDSLQVRGFGRHSFIIIVILYPASPRLAFTILHNHALIVLCRWRRSAYILTKMLCGLFDKVTRLMKANAVSLGVAHSLTNRSVVRLTGVAILCWAP